MGGHAIPIQHAADSVSNCVHSHHVQWSSRIPPWRHILFRTNVASLVLRRLLYASYHFALGAKHIYRVCNRASVVYDTISCDLCGHGTGSHLHIMGSIPHDGLAARTAQISN